MVMVLSGGQILLPRLPCFALCGSVHRAELVLSHHFQCTLQHSIQPWQALVKGRLLCIAKPWTGS